MKKIILILLMVFPPLSLHADTVEISMSSTNLGIGTTSVANQLSVKSGLAVGSTYVNTTAPSNGVIIQGNVGIGSLVPTAALDINAGGNNYFGANVGINSTSPNALLDVNGTGNNYLSTNLGIGSTNPGVALDVTGTIRMSGGTAGQATCFKTDKSLGQCTSIVGAGGACTCS